MVLAMKFKIQSCEVYLVGSWFYKTHIVTQEAGN